MTNCITQKFSFGLNPSTTGYVYLTVEYEIPSNVTGLSMGIPDILSKERTSGFKSSGRHQWKWDGHTRRPWIRYNLQLNRTRNGGHEYVDADSWALFSCPPVNTSWQYTGSEVDVQQAYNVEGEGVISSDGNTVYLGRYNEHQFTSGGQRFRLINPDSASLKDEPETIAASLGHTAEHLTVGGRNNEVVAVAAPSHIDWAYGGLHTGSNGFWTVDSVSVNSVNNTWVHEYVHTRQEWSKHSSTKWLIEGTTNFYASLLSYLQGRISFATFHRYVSTNQDSESVMAEPSRWTSPSAHYTKGRRVTAALDAEIRRTTDGQSSFQDVFRRINSLDKTLTNHQFKLIVADVAGESVRTWLERYIESSSTPDVPDRPDLFPPKNYEPLTEDVDSKVAPEKEPTETGTDIEQKICFVCDTPISTDEPYCHTCGTSLSKQCPVCGCQAGDKLYCPGCGSQLIEECPTCGQRRHGSEQFCSRCGWEF